MKQNNKKIGKYISLILRHKPEAIGIELDRHGWADVDALLKGVGIDMATLEEIVRTDDKGRFSFNEDKKKIRANQGHSINVDVELERINPDHDLYHGTGEKYVPYIDVEGLKAKNRLYVHLSDDLETAVKVGSRHGKPVIYLIDCFSMIRDGYTFYRSVNGVWLTKEVPVGYLIKITED